MSKGNKESKKPKADKSKKNPSISAYKSASEKGAAVQNPFAAKKK